MRWSPLCASHSLFRRSFALIALDVRKVTPRQLRDVVIAYYHARWKRRLFFLRTNVSAYYACRSKTGAGNRRMVLYKTLRVNVAKSL